MKILAISAHPDDETLGCGGTLLKLREAGHDIYWLVATQAYEPKWPTEVIEQKSQEVEKVAAAYGMSGTYRIGLPAARLDTLSMDELMGSIRPVVFEVSPEIVYLVHGGDIHSDHRAVFSATASVLKPFNMRELGVRRILSYESLSSTDAAPPYPSMAFVPNVFNDITPYMDGKLAIMETYKSEVHRGAMPRTPSAIRALARYRGATIGVEYAEAFMLIRELS